MLIISALLILRDWLELELELELVGVVKNSAVTVPAVSAEVFYSNLATVE
jgi:hypothetical protein